MKFHYSHNFKTHINSYFRKLSNFTKYAYRFSCVAENERTIIKHDNDDDGEDGSGSRLAQLLAVRKEDGVLVVVSRWFGGIHLGPKRFAHIVNAAREILDDCHEKNLL